MMAEWVGWSNGSWLPVSNMCIPLDDLGHLQSAVVVERMRTVGGKLLDWDEHWSRFETGCKFLGIVANDRAMDLGEIARELVEEKLLGLADFSLVLLATPGSVRRPETPTWMIYPQPIPWRKLHDLYSQGENLVVARCSNVPANCWPPQLKTRARLQYYLADHEAQEICRAHDLVGQASGLLLNDAGAITETSTANVGFVIADRLVVPEMDSILHGISLLRTLRLAEACGIPVTHHPVTVEEAIEASEILCMGTTGCLWHAKSLRLGEDFQEWSLPQAESMT
ncbi:MAG: aminotransferase class IV, partial [Planctomycetota bacterium]